MAEWHLFVYGSLKSDQCNHHPFCSAAVSVVQATARGKLFRQSNGYPMLMIPQESVVEMGSDDRQRDAERLAEVARSGPQFDAVEPSTKDAEWQTIEGEIVTFRDWRPMGPLDQLEEFLPAENVLVYHRVIMPVMNRETRGVQLVWGYVAPDGILPPGCTPLGNQWNDSMRYD